MRVIISGIGGLGLSLSLLTVVSTWPAQAFGVKQLAAPQAIPNVLQADTAQYETYRNHQFNFTVEYPKQLLFPLSAPAEDDGRLFVSADRAIRMVAYGRPQVDKSLETFYQSLLQSHQLRGSEVTVTDLATDQFVIAGYAPDGDVFYHKTLLRDNEFLILALDYPAALQPEFDDIVAAIAQSFQAVPPQADTPRLKGRNLSEDRDIPDENLGEDLEVPSLEREIRIYFPEENQNIFVEVAPVTRVTARPDVAEFALEALLQGPTADEQDQAEVKPLSIQLLGESTCEGKNFNINLEETLAIVQFCRTVIRGGIAEEARLEESIRRTLIQFPTITEVVLLDKNGNCLIDARGNDDCLARLPAGYR
jgi:hypothetical protein